MPESHKQWKSNYHILYSGQQYGVPFDFLKKCCKEVSAMKAVFTFKPIQVNLGTPFCINCNSIVVLVFFVTFLEPYFTECVSSIHTKYQSKSEEHKEADMLTDEK